MNALHRIHDALVPGGLVIDTQPVSARPPIDTESGEIGRLDMSEWADVIATVDGLIEQTIGDGLFALEDERRVVVTDDYDDGPEFVEDARTWVGTRVDDQLADRLAAESHPVRIRQDIRLRLLRAR